MKTFLAILALVLIGVSGTIGTMVALEMIDPNDFFGDKKEAAPAEPVNAPPDDRVSVILSVKHLQPYTQIKREDLFDPRSNRPVTVRLRLADLDADVITNYEGVVGRVLKRAHGPQRIFRESDFFPPGTRPGVVAAVEPGMRAIVLSADSLAGVNDLRIGDRIDIFATFESAGGKAEKFTASEYLLTESLLAEERESGERKPGLNSGSRIVLKNISNNAVIVKPVTARVVPEEVSATLTQASHFKEKPIFEVTIALNAEEIPALYEAIAMGASLHCAFRSGQPLDPAEEINIPELEAETTMPSISVELIQGKNRRIQTVKPTND